MLSSEKADDNSRKTRRNSYIKSESSDTADYFRLLRPITFARKWIALLLHYVIEYEIASYFAYGNLREQIRGVARVVEQGKKEAIRATCIRPIIKYKV